jgi:glutathionylspermidine synthase
LRRGAARLLQRATTPTLGDSWKGSAMADEETIQLLRDILAAQKAQLEYLQRQDQTYVAHSKDYEQSTELYKQTLKFRPWESAVRAITAIGVVLLLAYLVLRG